LADNGTDLANDFALKIGTVNGTGSASANGLLMQAIFRMGIPVSGKNIFPSNIQGLPTWYEIRVNGRGHLARASQFDLMVAMNPATYEQDIAECRSGGWVMYDSTWPLPDEFKRDDVNFVPVPFAKMAVENFEGARNRILMTNIAYVGALIPLLGIDAEMVKQMLTDTFGKKPHLLDANYLAMGLGYDYVEENFDVPLPFRAESISGEHEHVMLTGNMATGLGCVYAGATVGCWYPITPSTSIMDSFKSFCERYRKDAETGKNNFCIIQAEDELAAIGMVLGASWMGARAFTPTSGAGLSLMNELIGLAYYAEVPTVLFDVQRTGPSTGMPTRTQQGDLFEVVYASHGDTKHIALFPADPGECFYFARDAFDLAERFQTPVFVVTDLDIGMNDWMVPRLEWDDDYVPDRGKVLNEEQIEQIDTFYRYLDTDGDHIPYRTLPGVHPKGAYFTRGSGHDKFGRYTENSAAYKEVVDRIALKVESAAHAVPAPEMVSSTEETRVGVLTIGGCRAAVLEALELLEEDEVHLDFLRVRGFPFSVDVEAFLTDHDVTYVIEQNRDGQLLKLLLNETGVTKDRLRSLRFYDGMPLSAREVVDGITSKLPPGVVPESKLEGVG
jgi:2-oxoglutarate/2-oxoacid ferredoxin oxidoreductase subunit alpha